MIVLALMGLWLGAQLAIPVAYWTGPARREVVVAPEVIAVLCDRPDALAVEVVDVEHGARTERCP